MMILLGLLELALWTAFCFFMVDKVSPWLNDWLVDGLNERDEARAKK